MDPTTGAIKAMANYPTYNPSEYSKVTDYAAFVNGTVSTPYENGSVIKTLTVGAGLDAGAITANSTFNDSTGCTSVDGVRICNVEEDPKTSAATMLDTLRYSLNTGVVHVLRQMGGGSVNQQARETLGRYFMENYRYGKSTGIEQAGEAKGTIVGPNESDGRNVRYANMTFGQGMNTTMIQTAAAFSAAVNGGTYYKPTLIKGTLETDGTVRTKQPLVVPGAGLSTDASLQLRDLIWQGRKTGFFGKFDPEGYKIGGKTGTSQVIDTETGKYTNENSIGSYLGFGGTDTPQYVIMVKVDDSKAPGYAGTIAAGPIFNELSNWMLKYLKLTPKV